MDVRIESVGEVVVIAPIGTRDAGNSKKFKAEASPAADRSDKVRVDLSGRRVIDSRGLAVILSSMRPRAGRLV